MSMNEVYPQLKKKKKKKRKERRKEDNWRPNEVLSICTLSNATLNTHLSCHISWCNIGAESSITLVCFFCLLIE